MPRLETLNPRRRRTFSPVPLGENSKQMCVTGIAASFPRVFMAGLLALWGRIPGIIGYKATVPPGIKLLSKLRVTYSARQMV